MRRDREEKFIIGSKRLPFLSVLDRFHPSRFHFPTTSSHEHSRGLSLALEYTYTLGLLRAWKIHRQGISAAQPRLEARWNNGEELSVVPSPQVILNAALVVLGPTNIHRRFLLLCMTFKYTMNLYIDVTF